MAIQVGQDAPEFELASNELENGVPGKKVRLSDFRGKKAVVLAFYPLDFSPVCSNEHRCFVEDFSELERAGAQVLGISVDSKWTHMAFARHLGLNYPLLADFQPRGDVANRYGLFLPDRGTSARATVVVDKLGKVAWVHEEPSGQARDNKLIVEELRKLG
jgi:peroxiredoxin